MINNDIEEIRSATEQVRNAVEKLHEATEDYIAKWDAWNKAQQRYEALKKNLESRKAI